MLNYEFPPLGGGAGNATKYLLTELAKHHDIHIDLVTSATGKYQKEIFSENIRIFYLNIGKSGESLHYQSIKDLVVYTVKAYIFSKTLIKNYEYDCIHSFFGIPCGWIAKNLNLPYIVSLRGSDVPFYNPRFKIADKLVFQHISKKIWEKARYVIANSQGLQTLATNTLPHRTIHVIPNGVDTRFFYPVKKTHHEKRLHIVTVSRLIKRKGIDILIRAIAGVNNVALTIAGEGNMKDELRELAQSLNVNVKFAGILNKTQLRRLYQNADMFVLPSLNEGMSNSALEAMACGLPIILTDVGGSYELIDDNGRIVQAGTPEKLCRLIKIYRDNPGMRDKHGTNSRLIAKKLNWGATKDNYIEIYRKCIAQR